MKIVGIDDGRQKSLYTEKVLRRLPDWFGIETALADYVAGVSKLPFWVAMDGDDCVGVAAVKIHHGHTGEIYVMGILPEYHRRGIGMQLMEAADIYFKGNGCKYVVVKTLSALVKSNHYHRTRKFYLSVGFEPLITLTEVWDEDNPCLIMIKRI